MSSNEDSDEIRLPDKIIVDNTGAPYISVAEYMRVKLERNRIYVKFLETHNELLRKEILLNYRTFDMNNKKIKVFEEINQIEQLQATRFVSVQETKVTKMYSDVNRLEPLDYERLQTEIEALRRECLRLRIQIDNFNEQIPHTVNIVGIE